MDLLILAMFVAAAWLYLKGRAVVTNQPAQQSADDPYSPAQGNDALDNIMQAIYQFEGGKPGNRNVVNNNPGNLRSGPGMVGTQGGYANFADQGDGWDALQSWVMRHVGANPDWDFYDLFSYYLRGSTTKPTSDAQGNSDAYAEYVAGYLGVNPSQPVSSVMGS